VTCKFGIQTLNASPIRHWDLALLSLPSTFHDTLIVAGRTELSLNYGMI
jgi:BarA-like signal transduction histidine kinase